MPALRLKFALLTTTLLALGAAHGAAKKQSLPEVIAASKAEEWRAPDPENTLYMQIPSGRVVIELAPNFAPNHAANIKAMVREGYFDGLFIHRSADNFVVQWGDPDDANPRKPKTAKDKLKAEFTAPIASDKHFTRLKDFDGYAPQVGHSNGFPVGRDPKAGQTWLTHCYGMVGVGRDNDPDTGSGTALYVVTGHAPRALDRNITVVGRVIAGMPLLSVMPRGPAPMGMYDKPEMNVTIASIKIAADVPEAERSKLEIMRTDSASYQKAVESQRNRPGPFYIRPAGHIELCNAPIPVRAK
jgi:cyclophilin family peptidyl-prolyl cis-trans isomerase